MDTLLDELAKDRVRTDRRSSTTGCAGLCNREPVGDGRVKGQPPGLQVRRPHPRRMRAIFTTGTVLGGHIVAEYALAIGSETVY